MLAPNSVTTVIVNASASFCTLTTVTVFSFSFVGRLVLGQDLFDGTGPVAPQLLVPVEQLCSPAHRAHLGVHDLLLPTPLLSYQRGPLQHGHVFLHGREAHRVLPCERGDRLLLGDHPGEDVAPGGVRQGLEDSVGLSVGQAWERTYNHMVVR